MNIGMTPLAQLGSAQSGPQESYVEPICDSTYNPYTPIVRSSTPDNGYSSINICRIGGTLG